MGSKHNVKQNNSNEQTIMQNTITKDTLREYVKENEVVYQFCGDLMEVSNDIEKENKETLLGYFRRANCVEVYTKHDSLAKKGWTELADWSTDDDVLFILDGVGVLICIPKKEATANNLIEA